MSAAAQPNKAGSSAGILQCESEAAGQVAGRELKVIIRPLGLEFWEYEGTRAQLETEGVIPLDIEWPKGDNLYCWEDERFRWQLQRDRPEGLKGPKRLWVDGDWWNLRCIYKDGLDDAAREILKKKRELDEVIYRHSPAGKRERAIACCQYLAARDDKVFQSFKCNLLGVNTKTRRAGRSAA